MFWSRIVASVPAALCLLFGSGQGSGQDVEALRNVTLEVEGRVVTLVDGVAATEAAPGSAARVVTRYLGHEALGDLDKDGVADAAFVVTQTRGGSGTFFYVVAARGVAGGYVGSGAVPLGDRVAPQSVIVRDGTVVVTFADRRPGAPMTAPPTEATSKTLRMSGAGLVGA